MFNYVQFSAIFQLLIQNVYGLIFFWTNGIWWCEGCCLYILW